MIAWDDILAKGVALDDHLPVNIYKGATKIAGWHAQTVSGEGTISLDGAYNVPPDALVIDGKCQQTVGVWGTNAVTNGDFSNGTTGFVRDGAASLSAAHNELILTIITGSERSHRIYQLIGTIAGHKYYAHGSIMRTTANTFRPTVGAATSYLTAVANTYVTYGIVLTALDTTSYSVYLHDTVAGEVIKFKNLLAIDLTATFGAGNEPTAAQMDAYLAAYPNSWFDGSAFLTTSGTPNSPSPTYPAPITTITGGLTITAANCALSDTVVTPLGSVELCSRPDGTKDTHDAVTGVVTKRVGNVVFDGSADEGWKLQGINSYGIANFQTRLQFPMSIPTMMICDKLTGQTTLAAVTTTEGFLPSGTEVLFFRFLSSRIATVDALRTWLATNPVTVIYKLAEPYTIQLTPDLPVVRTGIKTLTVSANITPSLTATVKAMD